MLSFCLILFKWNVHSVWWRWRHSTDRKGPIRSTRRGTRTIWHWFLLSEFLAPIHQMSWSCTMEINHAWAEDSDLYLYPLHGIVDGWAGYIPSTAKGKGGVCISTSHTGGWNVCGKIISALALLRLQPFKFSPAWKRLVADARVCSAKLQRQQCNSFRWLTKCDCTRRQFWCQVSWMLADKQSTKIIFPKTSGGNMVKLSLPWA